MRAISVAALPLPVTRATPMRPPVAPHSSERTITEPPFGPKPSSAPRMPTMNMSTANGTAQAAPASSRELAGRCAVRALSRDAPNAAAAIGTATNSSGRAVKLKPSPKRAIVVATARRSVSVKRFPPPAPMIEVSGVTIVTASATTSTMAAAVAPASPAAAATGVSSHALTLPSTSPALGGVASCRRGCSGPGGGGGGGGGCVMFGGGAGTGALVGRFGEGADAQPMTAQPSFSSQHSL